LQDIGKLGLVARSRLDDLTVRTVPGFRLAAPHIVSRSNSFEARSTFRQATESPEIGFADKRDQPSPRVLDRGFRCRIVRHVDVRFGEARSAYPLGRRSGIAL